MNGKLYADPPERKAAACGEGIVFYFTYIFRAVEKISIFLHHVMKSMWT